MLEKTEGAITKEQSRESSKIGYTRQKAKKKRQNMCWTPLKLNLSKGSNDI
jgi:hypothetical protein